MRSAGGRWWATAALCAVLLGACRSDDEGDALDTTSSSTTTTDASTTTTKAPACLEVLERAGEPEVVADLDGDGQEDRVHLAAPDAGEGPEHYVLQVVLGAGGGASTIIPADATAPPGVLGAAVLDAGGDEGPDVLWLRVGAGASTTVLGLFHLDGCELTAARFANGEPVELPIGGSVATASGARCGSAIDPEADLLVFEATSLSGRDYEVVTTEYRWEDGVLVLSPASAPAVTQTDDLSEVTGFRCGDLSL